MSKLAELLAARAAEKQKKVEPAPQIVQQEVPPEVVTQPVTQPAPETKPMTALEKLKALQAGKSTTPSLPANSPVVSSTTDQPKEAAPTKEPTTSPAPSIDTTGMSALEKLKALSANGAKLTTSTTPVARSVVPAKVTAPQIPEGVKKFDDEKLAEIGEDFNSDLFKHNILSLANAVIQDDQDITGYLRAIMQNANKYPELAYLLNDDQLRVITTGLLKKSSTQIVTSKIERSANKLKAFNNLSDAEKINMFD
jgi:hypothetical protein